MAEICLQAVLVNESKGLCLLHQLRLCQFTLRNVGAGDGPSEPGLALRGCLPEADCLALGRKQDFFQGWDAGRDGSQLLFSFLRIA